MRHALFAVLLTLTVAACHDDHEHGPEAFATFQECYDEHHGEESLPVEEAIVICCLEHPIAGVAPVCGNTETECGTYLGVNLASASATPAEVTAACTEYIAQKGM